MAICLPGIAAVPLFGDAGIDPLCDMGLKVRVSGGHKLRTMVKRGVANSSASQTSTEATTFIDNQYLKACLMQFVGRTESGKAGANNHNISVESVLRGG
jgi:hypothetical protein